MYLITLSLRAERSEAWQSHQDEIAEPVPSLSRDPTPRNDT